MTLAATNGVYSYRRLLLVAGSVYLLWWLLVDQLLPDAFNPLGSRLLVVASFFTAWAASFYLGWVKDNLRPIYVFCALLLTGHYYYLYAANSSDPNWLGGSYITVIAIGVTFEQPKVLLAYSAAVLTAAYYVSTLGATSVVSVPGTATVLFLTNVVAWLRRKADVERHLRQKAEAERAASETVTRAKMLFLANVNHELRTPLSGVMGFADLLSRSPGLDEDAKLYVDRIGANARTLLATVEQILALTGSEATPLTIKKEAVDVRQILEERVRGAISKAGARGIGLKMEVPVGLPLPSSDSGLIGYVVGNLLDNALKFTHSGRVRVSAQPVTGGVEVLVEDTGVGIAKDMWERIFDPFIQVDAGYDRTYGGSGVGLTVARKLARVLGGDVAVAKSELGKGTTMRFLVPLEPPAL